MMLTRREFIKSAMALTLMGLPEEVFASSAIADEKVKWVLLDITYTTKILRVPKRGPVRIWIPVPKTDKEQVISNLRVDSPIAYRITEDRTFGNRMLYLEADTLKQGQQFKISFRLKRMATGILKEPWDPDLFKEPSEWERWDEEIQRWTNKVVGKEKDPVRIARKIYDAIIDRLQYIHQVCGRGVAVLTLMEGKGRCDEYHALFRSMMMLKGIPVRWEQGLALPYPSELKDEDEFEADCINAHSWVRFYIGQGRWFPVDVSEADRHPSLRQYYFGHLVPNRIKLSTGRGISLVPKQEGIINTFAYTYIEAGGLPAIYGHHYRNRLHYKKVQVKT